MLTETVEAMKNEMDSLNAEVNRLQRRGPGGGGRDGDDGDDGGGRDRDSDLVDRKFFSPEVLGPSTIFREWKAEFEDFLSSKDKKLADLLEAAEKAKDPILILGDNPREIERAEKLYRIIKKLTTHVEARNILLHVPDRNPWEAWRLLTARFDAKNDAYHSRNVRDLLSVKVWKPKHLHELPSKIAQWEHEQMEHRRRTGNEVLTEALRRDMLMSMITPELKAQVEAAMLLVDDAELTYDKLKRFIIKFVARQMPPSGSSGRDVPAAG